MEEHDLDDFSPEEKNEIVIAFRAKAGETMGISKMAPHKTWVTLHKGSLIIQGETTDRTGEGRWPTDTEAREKQCRRH